MPGSVPPVVALCRELVRIPSPSGGEGRLAAFVAERMEAAGLRVETDRFGSVLGLKTGSAPGPTLLLDAHLDTVPPADPTAWSHDPFGGEIQGGRLFGVGAADTKGSLAAMVSSAEAFDDFAGTLLVSASVGEEDLTAAALSAVLDRHPADLVLVGEPTSLRLGTAQKGRAGLVVETRGRSAHSSRPELGENAVYRMLEAVARIRAVPLPSDPELGSGVCELIEIGSEPSPSTGMVPHRCVARFALRILPGETADAVVARYARALDGIDGLSVRLATLARPCHTGVELSMEEVVPGWRNADRGLEARLLDALGSSPFAAPYTTNASAAATRGIPAFLLGPGSIEQAHAVDEWVAVDELVAAVGAYAAAARAFLAARAAGGEPRPRRGNDGEWKARSATDAGPAVAPGGRAKEDDMSEPKVAARQPVAVKLEAGKTYAWCRCGTSKGQPFCDGSHKGTEFSPLVWKAEESKEAWLCQCKHTKNPPYCDGTHKTV